MTQAATLGDRFRLFETRVKDRASVNCLQDEYRSVKNDATLPAESEQVNFETQEDYLSHLLVSYLTENTSSDHIKEHSRAFKLYKPPVAQSQSRKEKSNVFLPFNSSGEVLPKLFSGSTDRKKCWLMQVTPYLSQKYGTTTSQSTISGIGANPDLKSCSKYSRGHWGMKRNQTRASWPVFNSQDFAVNGIWKHIQKQQSYSPSKSMK